MSQLTVIFVRLEVMDNLHYQYDSVPPHHVGPHNGCHQQNDKRTDTRAHYPFVPRVLFLHYTCRKQDNTVNYLLFFSFTKKIKREDCCTRKLQFDHDSFVYNILMNIYVELKCKKTSKATKILRNRKRTLFQKLHYSKTGQSHMFVNDSKTCIWFTNIIVLSKDIFSQI